MAIEHLVSCARCGIKVSARRGEAGSWLPPRGWLSIAFDRTTSTGQIVDDEQHHACPDCSQTVLDKLAEILKAKSPTT